MELSRTINLDKRYYLDENTIENVASLLQTMRVFNDAKIDLYNALYDQKLIRFDLMKKLYKKTCKSFA